MKFAWLLRVAVGVVALSSAAGSFPRQFLGEHPLDTIPIDLAVTPSGDVGAVRSTSDSDPSILDWITFYNLSTSAKITPQGCPTTTPWGGHAAGKAVSDLIVGDNAFFVALGGTDESVMSPLPGQDRTYIDFFRIEASGQDPPVIAIHCQANYFIENNGSQFTQAGNAHDIAMTPNGARIVVNHRNWIHVYNARGTLLAAFNVGNFPLPVPPYSSQAPQPTDPVGAVDSIGITNSRAIVSTNRPLSTGTVSWVYVVDLLTNPPAITVDQIIGGSTVSDQRSHDVAVSPNGNRAVVTSNGVVALIDLQNHVVLSVDENNLIRNSAVLRDSVETSNNRAVVISDSSESGTMRWRIQIFDITGPTLSLVNSFESESTEEDKAHDLALTPDGTKAVITSEQQNVIITAIDGAPSLVTPFVSDGLPFGNSGFSFVSDSVVADNSNAVVIRGDNPGAAKSYIYFYNLATMGEIRRVVEDPQGNEAIYPADLLLTQNGKVAIKFVRGPVISQAPGQAGGDDILICNLSTGAVLASYETSGHSRRCFDSIELSPNTLRILTVSDHESVGSNPIIGSGFTQITQY